MVRTSTGSAFEKVGRDWELKYGWIGQESFTYKIDTYGKIFSVPRADLIDDNVGLLNEIPMVIGNDGCDR